MTYEQVSAMYSLFITNVNRLTQRFGKVYFPNPNITVSCVNDDLDSIYKHDDGLLTTQSYKKYNGFLFPILLLQTGPSEFRILDGCHRYVYVDLHENVIILAIAIKDKFPCELSVPLELCDDTHDILYRFNLSGIECAKVSIKDMIDFRKMYVAFCDLIYDNIKGQDFKFEASPIVNKNSKIINKSYDKGDMFVPRFQYTDKYGVIKHASILPGNKGREYVNALYTMYSDNIMLLRNDGYRYLASNNINHIDISNDEWWDGVDGESLVESIVVNGIYFPIVYTKNNDNVYTIVDGLHRFIACRDILCLAKYYNKKYLLIPDKIQPECEVDIYIPKFIYDSYSYLFRDKCKIVSELLYMNTIESYIASVKHTGTIRLIRLLMERELNSLMEKGLFELLDIKSSDVFNGGRI